MVNERENVPRVTDNNIVNEVISHSEAREAIATPETRLQKRGPVANFLQKPQVRLAMYAVCVISIMIISIGVCTSVALQMTSAEGSSFATNNTAGNLAQESSEGNSSGSHLTFTKEEWGGKPALNFTKLLRHPTEYVVVSHTEGRSCTNFKDCASVLQQIQTKHVSSLKSVDTGYNFLIGGDGNVYIGRDWDTKSFFGDNIGISFVGNFTSDELKPQMISSLKDLLDLGVKLKKLPADFKLVCYNQIILAPSLGDDVCQEISKFKNFYSGAVDFN